MLYRLFVFTTACLVASPALRGAATASNDPVPPTAIDQQLQPTAHAALPEDVEDYWLVPSVRERKAGASSALASAANAYAAGNYAAALTSAQQAAAANSDSATTPYALYYQGLAQLRLARPDDAAKTFDTLLDRQPDGYLSVAATLGKGEAEESRGNHAAAAALYEKLTTVKTVAPEDVLSRLGRAALAAGDKARAAQAYLRVYYEFPLSDAAAGAASALSGLQDQIVRSGYKADLSRAMLLFNAKRYQDARTAFQELQPHVSGDDRELTDLRIAECEFFLKRYAAARDGLQPYLDKASRRAEARFFYLSALRELGAYDEYVSLTRQLVTDFPDSSWSEEALNNLGTYYIKTDDDERADDPQVVLGLQRMPARWQHGFSRRGLRERGACRRARGRIRHVRVGLDRRHRWPDRAHRRGSRVA